MLKELFQSAFYAGLVGCVLVAFYLMGAASTTEEEEEETLWGCFSFDERRFATTEEELLKDGAFLYATTPNEAGEWVYVYVLRDSIKGCMEVPTK